MPKLTFCRGWEHKTTNFFFCSLAGTSPFVVIFWFEYWILVLKCYREFRERGDRTTAEINFNEVTTFVIKRVHVSDESWSLLHPPYKLHKYQNPQLGRCDIIARNEERATLQVAEHYIACSHFRSTEFTYLKLDMLWHSVKRVKQCHVKYLNHAWPQQHIQKLQRISCNLFFKLNRDWPPLFQHTQFNTLNVLFPHQHCMIYWSKLVEKEQFLFTKKC